MPPEVTTKRLSLRRGAADDFDAIHSIFSRPEVAGMVANWPIPADPERTRRVCQPLPQKDGIAGPILLGDEIIGNMGVTHVSDGIFGMGYGLHPDHWGKGYATEMGTAVISAIFARYPAVAIKAGVWTDNPASGRVLEKLGLHYTHTGFGYAMGRKDVVEARLYELTRARWLAANPLLVQTDRLEIRNFETQDIYALHRMVGHVDVARMTASFSYPMSLQKTSEWALARRYQGRPGFCAGIYLKDGPLVGLTGLAPEGKSVMYAVAPEHWGRGYATEAQHAFLSWAFERFGLHEVAADHFHDNPASGRVLQKLGFRKAGTGMGQSKARLEPEPVIEYRLTRTQFESLS